MAAVEYVEPQIVVASEEPTFQVPVQRIVGEINIKDDLLRRV
jgi:hypothetical protein